MGEFKESVQIGICGMADEERVRGPEMEFKRYDATSTKRLDVAAGCRWESEQGREERGADAVWRSGEGFARLEKRLG